MSLFNGVKGFIWQSISAGALLLFTPYLLWLTLTHEFKPSLLLQPHVLLPGLVIISLLLVHAWIGLRDVLIDYAPRRHQGWIFKLIQIIGLLVTLNLIWLIIKIGGWA